MFQYLIGFTFGNVVGMYLAQTYEVPDIPKTIEEIKKYINTMKKPPSDES